MEPDRPTRPQVELRNAHTDPPVNGVRVLALGRGGSLVPEIWTSRSSQFFDAWMEYPKVPREVKELQLSRFK